VLSADAYSAFEEAGVLSPAAGAKFRDEVLARGGSRDNSDVDLFFDYERGKLGLFELMDVKAYAARILGTKTDVMTRDSLHKVLRQEIEASAIRVF